MIISGTYYLYLKRHREGEEQEYSVQQKNLKKGKFSNVKVKKQDSSSKKNHSGTESAIPPNPMMCPFAAMAKAEEESSSKIPEGQWPLNDEDTESRWNLIILT